MIWKLGLQCPIIKVNEEKEILYNLQFHLIIVSSSNPHYFEFDFLPNLYKIMSFRNQIQLSELFLIKKKKKKK